MSFHIFIIGLQLTAIAAFLILWYFWVKRKMGITYGLDEEENVLFPFRSFSWILLGVVLITCLVQIHFVRVSASVYEKLVTISKAIANQKPENATPANLQATLSELQAELRSGFSALKSMNETQLKLAKTIKNPPGINHSSAKRPSDSPPKRSLGIASKPKESVFDGEAKASSRQAQKKRAATKKSKPEQREVRQDEFGPSVYSMRLNLMGKVKATTLNVRKRPLPHSLIVEKLNMSEMVKVTEKRVSGAAMWYRIVTPTGRAGWVDYRYLKLEEMNTDNVGA